MFQNRPVFHDHASCEYNVRNIVHYVTLGETLIEISFNVFLSFERVAGIKTTDIETVRFP